MTINAYSLPRKTLVYPVPLGSFTAQLVVPADLQPDEAARLCTVVRALAVNWKAAAHRPDAGNIEYASWWAPTAGELAALKENGS
jgi:hypothetical protein